LAVGILDTQAEDALVVARVQPIEQGGASTTDVQEAGRGGCKTNDDGHGASVGCGDEASAV
jgi:hypothetical protein